ncbi:hypothetical protein [Allomesorhizobium alhagi]|uniref:Uncharacterized protein n=1 Tax=Mesorhizobium alhagi CCNWXJ12-2 TaxID=1107882 RepID=H0HNE3_9HYPH|nr:hypothetical protein [Mesorhizobium alhagi]EHK57715.1 hypothetical protein MAXJ12_08329 [Mesorhizobium alhagi CCNWXJ12-2]
MARSETFSDEELALLTKAERDGLLGVTDDAAGEPLTERQRHLAWCKERALEYLDRDDCRNAVASFLSDVQKHPSTAGLAGGGLAIIGMREACSGDVQAVERWIEGFN